MHKGFEDGERARSVRKKEGTYVYFLLSPPKPVAFAVNKSPPPPVFIFLRALNNL